MPTQFIVTPACCSAVVWDKFVHLTVDDDGKPGWSLALAPYHERGASVWEPPRTPKFCPYCGSSLPDIEPRLGVTAPVFSSEEGYYCDTCRERCDCCICLPRSALWQPVRSHVAGCSQTGCGDGLDPDAAYAAQKADEEAYSV